MRGRDVSEYQRAVKSFVDWCELNHLQFNISNAKELVVDFRGPRIPASPFN